MHEYYQYTVQRLDAPGKDWCCWISQYGRTKHCVEGFESAPEALAAAIEWASTPR